MSHNTSLESAVQDLATSGITPGILGVPMSELLSDIIPLNLQVAQQFFEPTSALFKGRDTLRPNAGYFWKYADIARFKNLDPDFLEYRQGRPVIDRYTGFERKVSYLSPPGKTPHLYMKELDRSANESSKGLLVFTEGEKKKTLLYYLLLLIKRYTEFSLPYLDAEYKYGTISGSGIFNFLPSPEWETLQVRGKPILLVFDADWTTNTDVALAEIKLTSALMAKGASLSKVKSLVWSQDVGKGIDDYLIKVYRDACGDENVFDLIGNNGTSTAVRIKDTHPMLNALNELVKFSVHPFQKYKGMGLDFICQAIASIGKSGMSFDSCQQEETVEFLSSRVFTNLRTSVIRNTLAQKIKLMTVDAELAKPFPTELRNSERFIAENRESIRWNITSETWMLWNGQVWQPELRGKMHQMVKSMLRQIQSEIPAMIDIDEVRGRRLAKIAFEKWETKTHLNNVLEHARTEDGVSMLTTEFDVNPYMVNTLNGIYHLDRNAFAQHTPEAYLSRQTGVAYNPDATYHEWLKFINLIFDNGPKITQSFLNELDDLNVNADLINELAQHLEDDSELDDTGMIQRLSEAFDAVTSTPELLGELEPDSDPQRQKQEFLAYGLERARKRQDVVDFIQKAVGVSLCGLSDVKALFFCYGPAGNNGKSTFFNVLEKVFGSYFGRIAAEALMMKGRNTGGINEDIADLRGKRMVVTDETEENRRLNVGLVKTLTGAEGKIRAERKYEHRHEFEPTHTLWMYGNRRPQVGAARDPIWERIKVIPFTVQITKALPPEDLLPQSEATAKLFKEASGILNWILLGWQMYQDEGLKTPQEVQVASMDYQREGDLVSLFLEECCMMGKDYYRVLRGDLYAAYMQWSESNHERPMGKTLFFRDIESRGYQLAVRGSNRHFFDGIGLITEAGSSDSSSAQADGDDAPHTTQREMSYGNTDDSTDDNDDTWA